MKCPVCENTELELRDIDIGLGAGVCPRCEGKWISFQSYQAWVEFEEHVPSYSADEERAETISKFERARICPRCRRILTKYRIETESALSIDRCSNCAGAWLDAVDWEALKSRNLHFALDKIFTDNWQYEINRQETRQTLADIYRKKFGPENFERIREFKEWVFSQEDREEILSYLRDNNPLQI